MLEWLVLDSSGLITREGHVFFKTNSLDFEKFFKNSNRSTKISEILKKLLTVEK